MSRKILIVTQYFYPENFRVNDIVYSLRNRGYEIIVLTGLPNYPKGSFFNGYNWFTLKKDKNYLGIKVIRLPIFPRGKTKFSLALNFISFWFLGLLFALFCNLSYDAVLTYGLSPIIQGSIGISLAKKRKVKSYLYLLDFWPYSVSAVDGLKKGIIYNLIKRVSFYIYLNTNIILISSKGYLKDLISIGVKKQFITYWPQYYEDYYKPVFGTQMKALEIVKENKTIITFTGNLGIAQGLNEFGLFLARNKDVINGLNIVFYFLGDGRGKKDFVNFVHNNLLMNLVKFIESKPPEEIPYYLAKSDIALLLITDNSFMNQVIPAKLQTYLACNKPIFSISNGYISDFINDNYLGVATKSYDDRIIIESLIKIINNKDNYKNNPVIFANKNFSKENLLNQLEKTLFGSLNKP